MPALPKLTETEAEIYERHHARIAAARQRTRFRRAAVFAPGHVDIGGFVCRRLTIGHVGLLEAVSSPFLYKLPKDDELLKYFLSPAATLQLLWILSPHYLPETSAHDFWSWISNQRAKSRLSSLTREFARRGNYDEIRKEAFAYVTDCFLDLQGSPGSGESYVSTVAAWIHTLAASHGWTRDDIRSLEVTEALQYVNIINHKANVAAGVDAPKFNVETDSIHKEMLVELNNLLRKK